MTVRAVTVDALAARYQHPHFLKVDVEGHELGVFAGAAATLERADRPAIVFEALTADALEQSLGVLTRLSAGGYGFMRIRNDGSLVSSGDSDGSSDYLALPAWAEARLSP